MFNRGFCSYHSSDTADLFARCLFDRFSREASYILVLISSTAPQKPRPPPFGLFSFPFPVSILQITFGLRKTAQFIAFLAFDVEALALIEEAGDVAFTAAHLNPVSIISTLEVLVISS